jgi:hypothetical protein
VHGPAEGAQQRVDELVQDVGLGEIRPFGFGNLVVLFDELFNLLAGLLSGNHT